MAHYAAGAAERLGDRVRHWFVLNEPNIHALMGFGIGLNAPGRADERSHLAAIHHQNLAQAAAVDAIREVRDGVNVGTVLSLQQVLPVTDRDDDRRAAEQFGDVLNGAVLDPPFLGRYPASVESELQKAGLLRNGDLQQTRARFDMLGVNYYGDFYVAASPDGPVLADPPVDMTRTNYGWPVTPAGLHTVLTRLRDDYGNPTVVISENGVAEDRDAEADVALDDTYRIRFLDAHLRQVHRAIGEGCDVRGFFTWPFSTLVVATGAVPRAASHGTDTTPATSAPHVPQRIRLRTFGDALTLRAALRDRPGTLLVVGGGAEGTEVAVAAAASGWHVVERLPVRLSRWRAGLDDHTGNRAVPSCRA